MIGFEIRETQAQGLNDLTRLQEFTAHRVTSTDPSGGNLDMRRVKAGDTLTVAELKGPGVINHIWFTIMYPSRSYLRKLVLRVYFDDIPEPCVEAPIGDFFGLGHSQVYAYSSAPLAVATHCGLNSYWRMPFASRAKVTVTNDGAQDCPALYYQVDYQSLPKPLPDDLHFFASYRQAYPCEKGKHYLICETDGGTGHYVGCNLSIEQKDDSWWGEGDMRIYVDGEKKPCIEGTGSEDDFGGAWCYSHEFSYPQIGAPLRARMAKNGVWEHCTPDLRDKALEPWRWPQAWKPGDIWNVYRYHVSDPVPFRKSIHVNIEHGWINNERGDWYSSVAYWYQTGKPSKRAALPALADRMPGFLRPHDYGEGRWEAEDFVDVAKASVGEIVDVGMDFWGDMFSNRHVLQWDAQKTGDSLILPIKTARASRYKVAVRLCWVEPGGSYKVGLDDLPATDSINLYAPPPFPGLFDMLVAEADLAAGDHSLKFIAQDSAKESKGRRLIVDSIRIEDLNAPRPTTKPAS